MAATNAPSQLHMRTASSPQQQKPQQPLLNQPQRSATISRRQFGPVPVSARTPVSTSSSSTLAPPTPTPTNGRLSTPPPSSPQSRPILTANINSINGAPNQSVKCPICNITIKNILQLNQHLDKIHPEEPDDVKSAVSQLFKNIAKNATTTFKNIPANPSELLRKIQDLDIDSATAGTSLSRPNQSSSGVGFTGWTDPAAESVVTKQHWIRETDRDNCFHPNCEKGLGIRFGRQNCRCCGKLFCDTHSSYQAKLNARAKHDSNGLWCRVCEGCFLRTRKEEDKLNAGGVHRSLTSDFLKTRKKCTEKKHLEVNRLENRIEKLAQIHLQNEPGQLSSPLSTSPTTMSSFSSISSGTGSIRAKGLLRSVTSRAQQLKASEQAIVKWEDDSNVLGCHICLYGNRKHHCRLCGRVICDNCSKNIPLYLSMSSYPDGSESVGHTRGCKECIHMVFKRREHAADQKRPNAVVKYYESLMRLKARIDPALPRFQEMIASIGQKADMNQSHPDYQLAAKTRKELLDDFALFDAISKKIAKLPAHSQHQKHLHSNLYWWATQYLQTNMFPLSVIPKVFGNGGKESKNLGTSSPALSTSPAPSITSGIQDSSQDNETEINKLAMLSVLEEQRQRVESYIEEANRKRKFDDAKSLKISLEDLENEIASIRSGKRT
ncbi:carboxypeptidase Y-deficient [Entomortierella beljakovae]|nr:carboxypeptidase Y-deficient [Entomortierella beljakovae]